MDLVPLPGVFPLSQSLDHAGPLTRNVERHTRPGGVGGLADGSAGRARRSAAHRCRRPPLWLDGDHAGSPACLDDALKQLRAAGGKLIELEIPGLGDANTALGAIVRPEVSLIHAGLPELIPPAARTRRCRNRRRTGVSSLSITWRLSRCATPRIDLVKDAPSWCNSAASRRVTWAPELRVETRRQHGNKSRNFGHPKRHPART